LRENARQPQDRSGLLGVGTLSSADPIARLSGDLMDSVKSLQIGEAIYESAMNGGKIVEVKQG
jgi:hypothetical protein